MSSDRVSPAPEILNSWKEIARYLDRGTRTVQRWELEAALPIRRPRPNGHGRSAVFAFRSELDAWLASCQIEKPKLPVLLETPIRRRRHDARRRRLSAISRELILDSRRLQRTALDSQAQLNEAIVRLNDTVTRLLASRASVAAASPLPRADSLLLAVAAVPAFDAAE